VFLEFLPRVQASISQPVDPGNPFSASVTIVNSGRIPLNAVSVRIGLGLICGARAPCSIPLHPDPNIDYSSSIGEFGGPTRRMAPGDQFTFVLDQLAVAPDGLKYADIAVIVDYEVPVIRYKREKKLGLFTRKETDGRTYWSWK